MYKPPIQHQQINASIQRKAVQCARHLTGVFVPVVFLPLDYRTNALYLVGTAEERMHIVEQTAKKRIVRVCSLQDVIDSMHDGQFVILHYIISGGGRGGGSSNSSSSSSSNNTSSNDTSSSNNTSSASKDTSSLTVQPVARRCDSNCQITFRIKKGVAGTGGLLSTNGKKLYTLTVQLNMWVSIEYWTNNMTAQDHKWCVFPDIQGVTKI